MKQALGWVVNWSDIGPDKENREPRVTVDLFFSSREKFNELLGCSEEYQKEQVLVPINVPSNFDKWDYIPENY